MTLFLIGILLLVVGYFSYGALVEKILGPDDRQTPAFKNQDALDYVPMPTWKNMLIHLLNIAGIGPVIGVIAGIKFGTICFLIIPIGNIIAGATYDMICGFMSLRHNGANLPQLVQITAGQKFYKMFSVFLTVVLLLIVAVFINIPAGLLNGLFPPTYHLFFPAVILIFIYYIIATLLPIDKIIGKSYPFFGLLLLLASLALFVSICHQGFCHPEVLQESEAFLAGKFTTANNKPIIPLLFVTIACGIISGFHATQSPLVARTMKTERHARRTFYGMMVIEGLIAMIWGAAALIIYNKFPQFMSKTPIATLQCITDTLLSPAISIAAVLSVVVLSITSGDTAMRALRLSLAESLHISQVSIAKRLYIVFPLIAIIAGLLVWSNASANSFNILWNYFAWGNQLIASCALTCATIWLIATRRHCFIALIPCIFITFIVSTFIVWTSPAHGGPLGLGLELNQAILVGAFVAILDAAFAYTVGHAMIGKFDQEKA